MNKEIERKLRENFSYSPNDGKLYKNGVEIGTKGYHGYLKLTFMKKEYQVHRLCWFLHCGVWPNIIDHINHDKTDNRLSNIRDVDHKTNNMNQSLRASNKLGLSGVYWCKVKKSFRAQIRVDGVKTNLGSFKTLLDAAATIIKARRKYGYHENHGGVNAVSS